MFKEVGLNPSNPPKTWNEVKEYASLIKQKTGNYGIFVEDVANWAIDAMVLSNGGQIYKKGGMLA